MSVPGLPGFDRTVQETNEWLLEVSAEMGDRQHKVAYHALRGVLFALRDRLPIHEALHLSAQLPMLLRDIFFEGYQAAGKPEKYHRAGFLEHVSFELQKADHVNPEKATRAVFSVLQHRLSEGEIADIRNGLPADLRSLWPEVMVS